MALIENKKTISIDDIRTGQVLQITYDGQEDLVLVVDPNAQTVVNTSQGRAGKLHAIKLKSLSEYDMFKLIKMVRKLKSKNPRVIYDAFKESEYSLARRNYRTYKRDKIARVQRVTIGQLSKGTNRLVVDNSILYGVNHYNYVEVSISYYPNIIKEIKDRGYKIFYEGTELAVPEPIVMEFFDILETFDDTFDTSQLKFESWDIDLAKGVDELTTILPIFGPAFVEFKDNVQKGIGQQSVEGKTLLDVLEMSAGSGGWIKKASPKIIKSIVSMAPSNVADELIRYLQSTYSESILKRFHALGQTYAFADFEGPEIPRGTEIDNLQKLANHVRDVQLKQFMETKPGVYFAGSGHISLVKKLL